ncbi:hypothetical protein EVAR_53617_1 [Eumeta japonica]|uniref:Uncharacterized protein n=1 Tax=Eumeta variegata TaxID=151549 RepID=A0A4C1X067_EUMVA|nr:hypothetical protein EVAR_53617_1 [Eumeta japonica]
MLASTTLSQYSDAVWSPLAMTVRRVCSYGVTRTGTGAGGGGRGVAPRTMAARSPGDVSESGVGVDPELKKKDIDFRCTTARTAPAVYGATTPGRQLKLNHIVVGPCDTSNAKIFIDFKQIVGIKYNRREHETETQVMGDAMQNGHQKKTQCMERSAQASANENITLCKLHGLAPKYIERPLLDVRCRPRCRRRTTLNHPQPTVAMATLIGSSSCGKTP